MKEFSDGILSSLLDMNVDDIFRDWVVDRGLYNYPTTCKEPERLSEKMWDVVRSSEFACKVNQFGIRDNLIKSLYFVSAGDRGIKRNRLQPTGIQRDTELLHNRYYRNDSKEQAET